MIKINLILDGNYIMQKSVYSLQKNKLLDELKNVLEKDYEILSNLYHFDKIYFISDSKHNWRKDYYVDYKMTRKKDSKVDWDFVYKVYNEFQEYVSTKKNCEFCKIDNLEGDDLIAYITKKTNEKGYSNLIVANDSDLLQLIYFGDEYINFMYNFRFNDERIYIPKNYQIFTEKIESEYQDDLFEINYDMEFLDFLKEMIVKNKVTLIDSEYELFSRVVGYNKDSIKSIYMKGSRGIGKLGILAIYKLYKSLYQETIDFDSEEFKERLLFVIKNYKRIKDDNLDKTIVNAISRNLKLTKLDEVSTPINLYKRMVEQIKL